MRVIGIDPGLRRTGWGVIERREGGRLAALGSGVIMTETGSWRPASPRSPLVCAAFWRIGSLMWRRLKKPS